MTTISINNAKISVEDACYDSHDDRPIYEWRVRLADGTIYEGADLQASAYVETTEYKMLGTFLNCLTAGRYLELFPPGLYDWVKQNEYSIESTMLDMGLYDQ